MTLRRTSLLLLFLGTWAWIPLAQGQTPWPSSFLTGDDAVCQAEVAARLASGEYADWPPLELTEAARNEVQEEFDLRLLEQLTVRCGDYAGGRAALVSFLEREHAPLVEARARWLLAHWAWRLEDPARAIDERTRLGFLEDWYVLGPFDNERGRAFAQPLPPELAIDQQAFDLDALHPGKRGTVGWRRWSQLTPQGTVWLSALLRPAEEALAYLLTHVHVSEAQPGALRIGASGSVAVWWNGTEVARGDRERPWALDQDVVVVELARGWNRLLIKSGQTKGDWQVSARITRLDGTALVTDGTLLACSAEVPEELPDAPAPASDRPSTASAHRGALDHLALLDAAPLRDLVEGFIVAAQASHDRLTHPERRLFQRALTARPDLALAHQLLADSHDVSITHSAEREENRWRQHLEEALAMDAGWDRARVALARYHLERFGNLTAAGALLAAVRANPPPVSVLSLRAHIEQQQFGPPAAENTQRQLLGRLMAGELALEARLAWTRRLLREGRLPEAEALLARGRAADPLNGALGAEHVRLLLRAGRVEEARAQLERWQGLEPLGRAAARARLRFERSADDPAAALLAIEGALAVCPDDEELLREQGDVLVALERREAAMASYERALELDPNQPRVREALERLRGPRSAPDEPARVPIEDLIAAALRSEEPENTPTRVLLDNQAVTLAADGTARRYRQLLVKVINEEGCRALDSHSIPYAAGEQWVQVLAARAHHADGRVQQARIRNRPPVKRTGEYPVWSSTWLDLPPLRPGMVVELEWRTEDLKQSFFGDYFGDRVHFGGQEPRTRTIYTIDAPAAKNLYFHARGMSPEPEIRTGRPGRTIYRWELADQPRIDPEPAMPPLADLAPYVEVSTFRDWDAFSSWYHHLIRGQFHTSPAIQAKVEELTAGCTTDVERVRALYAFVVSEVRYIAWEFGVHGFQPYRADTIFTRRFGDCKDKATLLCTMLDEVGIEAYPVLIHATRQRAREDLALPLIHHFNHCIAYLPGVGPDGWFLDGTAEHHRADELPLMDRGARVLVVRKDGGELLDIRWNTPAEMAVTERQHARVERSGAAELHLEQSPTGDYAVFIRQHLEVAGDRKRLLEQRFGRRFPGTVVEDLTMSDLTDLTQEVKWRVSLRVPEYWDEEGGLLRLPPLADFFDSSAGLAGFVSRGERQHDLLLGNPTRTATTLEIELPPGVEGAHLPRATSLDTPHGRFHLTARSEGRRLVLEREFELRVPRVPVAEYPEFKEFLDDVNEALTERMTLRRVGGVE